MKRVLILGATGMLGSAVYSVLNKDCEIVHVYNETNNELHGYLHTGTTIYIYLE